MDTVMTGALPGGSEPPSATTPDNIRSQDATEPADQPSATNPLGGPLVTNPPSNRNPQGVIPSTAFAPTYRSIFTQEQTNQNILHLLDHVNCSYLSTPGLAPSLLQLKRHAQSLTILIKHLTISTKAGAIDNANIPGGTAPSFVAGETYDWLNNLDQVYSGPGNNHALARAHDLPLVSIANVLENFPTDKLTHDGAPIVGLRDKCPLHHAPEGSSPHHPSMPYATHQLLISHANEILELLDHEYSATGGLLSILPSKSQKEDREKAETTLLGQLILHMQNLVERLHTLERQYANSLDLLASEAHAPHQALSKLGPEGRKGREMVYPQDRFILVNAGNDVWSYLDHKFRQKDLADAVVERNYALHGVKGRAEFEKRGGKEWARGITALDVTTRYYRLKDDPLKTIFIIPAHQEHPGTKATREMEQVPTVVSVVKPIWPDRISSVEKRHRADLENYKALQQDYATKISELEYAENLSEALKYENELKDGEMRALRAKVEQMEKTINGPGTAVDAIRADVFKHLSSMYGQKEQAERLVRDAQKVKDDAITAHPQLKADQERLARDQAQFDIQKKDLEEQLRQLQQKKDDFQQQLIATDAKQAQVAVDLESKLKAVWKKQIMETNVLLEWLRQRKVDVENDVISQNANQLGLNSGAQLFNASI